MIAAWMLSASLFAGLLALAAWCAEYAVRRAGRQGRIVWMVALLVGSMWPMLSPLARRLMASTVTLGAAYASLPSVTVVPGGFAGSATTAAWAPSLDLVLCIMWTAASLLALGRLSRGLVVQKRMRNDAVTRTIDGAEVLVSPRTGPAVIGVRSPMVLMPEALLDLDAPLRRLIIEHEEQHCRERDHWVVIGSATVLALLPWNLPLRWIARRLRLALEVDCDARVISTGASPTQYAKLLLLVAQQKSAMALAPMLVESTPDLERRIIAMRTTYTSRSRVWIGLAVAGAILGVAAACTSKVGDAVVDPKDIGNAAKSVMASRSASPVLFEFQVEKPAQQVPATGNIRYPDVLRTRNVEGVVLAQFVVDTAGLFEQGSFKELKTSNALFTQAVENALPNMRFYPAEVGGRKVRQLVQQPFTFSLSSSGQSTKRELRRRGPTIHCVLDRSKSAAPICDE